jgi:hypothetical protein
MAEYNKGILGGFRGKVGTVVGAKWRGKLIMRSLPTKSNKKPTEAQMKQRAKFSLIAKFLSPIRMITSQFFGEYQGSKSRSDLAMSYQMTDTIIEHPNGELEIDFKKVVLSKGTVPTVVTESVAFADATVTVNWTDNSGEGNANADDPILLVVYSKENNAFTVSKNVQTTRKDKKMDLIVPKHWKAKDNIVWLLLSNQARNQASNSLFLGIV